MVLKKTDFPKKNTFEPSTGKSERKKETRFTIAVLFLGTIILSSLLWFQASFKDWWQKFLEPVSYKIVKPKGDSLNQSIGFQPDLKNLEGLEKSINLLLSDLSGSYGIYFYKLETKESLGIHEDQIFIAASINKIPIMVSFYKQLEKGELKEDEEYILKARDVQDYGTGILRYQAPGTKYTYHQLVELTGKKSDNTAAYVLESLIGQKTIQAGLEGLGMENTSMKDNTTTPKEMGDYLAKLFSKELVKEENRDKILSALRETDFEERIPKGIPEDIPVAHKIGNEIQTYNDCGLILSPDPYVLCILSKEVKEQEALEVLPKISRLVWEFSSQ